MSIKHKNTSEKLTLSIITVFVLSVCLCITTFALVWATVSEDNNLFHTGTVKINLNDGMPVIEEHEFLFEPGMTVKKDFFVENQSTWDVYYKLYFTDVDGGLADVLDVTIKDKDRILYSAKASRFTIDNIEAANDVLKLNERRELTIYFHFPEEAGNEMQNHMLTFSINADAVQAKNNPGKQFN